MISILILLVMTMYSTINEPILIMITQVTTFILSLYFLFMIFKKLNKEQTYVKVITTLTCLLVTLISAIGSYNYIKYVLAKDCEIVDRKIAKCKICDKTVEIPSNYLRDDQIKKGE